MTDISEAFDARVDVKNKHNQIALVLEETREKGNKETARDHVGGTNVVGDGEFRDLVGGVMNYKWIDRDGDGKVSEGDTYVNDAEKLLEELLLGDGISGVELVGLDGDSFTLAVKGSGGTTDYMIFEGAAAEMAIARVDAMQTGFDLNANNSTSQFAILDLSDPNAKLSVGGSGNLVNGELDVGNKLTADDVPEIIEQVLTEGGYSGAELIDVDANSISISFSGWNGTKDTLLITGINDALELVAGGPLDDFIKKGKTQDNFEINGPTNVPDGSLLDTFGFGNQISQSDINRGTGDTDLLNALVEAGGSISDSDEVISLVGVDSDSFTFSYTQTVGGEDYTDIFVFDYGPDAVA